MIGKLERVPLREVFPHEAYDLTKWLAENSDVISDAIGQRITISASEDRVGSFLADLVGEDESGNPVVIENQLGRSDHDHLGKLLTYVAGREAKKAIWIVGETRPEHTDAVIWLNETNLCSFYLFKLEAVRIGSSDPAPLLTLITGPSEELVRSGESKKEQAARYGERAEFWSALLPRSAERTSLFTNVSPGPYSYLWAGSGTTGIGYVYRLVRDATSVELYFGRTEEENVGLFQRLSVKRDEIDRSFGEELIWDEMTGSKACRLRYDLHLGGYRSPREQWPEIISATVDAMARLEKATRRLVREVLG